MEWIIGILLFVLAVGSFCCIIIDNLWAKIAGGIAGALFTILFICIPFSIHQVDAGEVAVVKVWGDAKEVRTAGVHYDFWMSHKYEIYDCKVQQTSAKTQAYSNDAQTMDIEIVIQYQIQQDNAMNIAKVYGSLDVLQDRVETVSIERAKSILSEKKALDIIKDRTEISKSVTESITSAITEDYYINIVTVVLTDISFSDEFEKSVEDSMVAQQEVVKAEAEKEKAIIKAEQELEVTRLNAEAKLAEAEGEAKAIEAIAKAEANAIKLKSIEVARMLGFEITETEIKDENQVVIAIEYDINFEGKTETQIKVISDYLKYIEYLNKWSGDLPSVMTGDGANIMIPVPTV